MVHQAPDYKNSPFSRLYYTMKLNFCKTGFGLFPVFLRTFYLFLIAKNLPASSTCSHINKPNAQNRDISQRKIKNAAKGRMINSPDIQENP